MIATTKYVRSIHKIHTPSCRYSANAVPWNWAEDKDDSEWIGKAWLKPCRTCLPELAAKQNSLIASTTTAEPSPSSHLRDPCPSCGCPGEKYDGHACEDYESSRPVSTDREEDEQVLGASKARRAEVVGTFPCVCRNEFDICKGLGDARCFNARDCYGCAVPLASTSSADELPQTPCSSSSCTEAGREIDLEHQSGRRVYWRNRAEAAERRAVEAERREASQIEALRHITHAGGDDLPFAEIPSVLAGVRALAGAMISLDPKHGEEALSRVRAFAAAEPLPPEHEQVEAGKQDAETGDAQSASCGGDS